MAQKHLERDNLQIKFFKHDSWSPRAGFFPIATYQLIKFEEEKIFGL